MNADLEMRLQELELSVRCLKNEVQGIRDVRDGMTKSSIPEPFPVPRERLAEILNENARLRRQVTELQEQSTRFVKESRRRSEKDKRRLSAQVREFMAATGQPVRDRPESPEPVPGLGAFLASVSEEVIRLRGELVLEEAYELLDAFFFGGCPAPGFRHLFEATRALVRSARVHVDLALAADALADLDYVVEGARATFGIDGVPVADLVHEANMKKVLGGRRDPVTGKILKPENWVAPDVRGEIARQAEEGKACDREAEGEQGE